MLPDLRLLGSSAPLSSANLSCGQQGPCTHGAHKRTAQVTQTQARPGLLPPTAQPGSRTLPRTRRFLGSGLTHGREAGVGKASLWGPPSPVPGLSITSICRPLLTLTCHLKTPTTGGGGGGGAGPHRRRGQRFLPAAPEKRTLTSLCCAGRVLSVNLTKKYPFKKPFTQAPAE